MKLLGTGVLALSLFAVSAEARVVALHIERREAVLNGKAFGNAGAYEKLVGKVEFAVAPKAVINKIIVDLGLAPRNA